MQNLASLEKGCSRSAHQAGAEEKSLCDLMDLNGLKRLCAFAFRWEQVSNKFLQLLFQAAGSF